MARIFMNLMILTGFLYVSKIVSSPTKDKLFYKQLSKIMWPYARLKPDTGILNWTKK